MKHGDNTKFSGQNSWSFVSLDLTLFRVRARVRIRVGVRVRVRARVRVSSGCLVVRSDPGPEG